MDNMFSNSASFIFQPESTFSILFLAIFIICLGYGVWLMLSSLKQWEDFEVSAKEKYATLRNRFLPETFVRLMQEGIVAKENKLSDLPNIFVTIGILGTFIGLGVAIQGAAALLNDEKIDIAKLNAMLGVIAFKFQISVWGTIFSLAFQKIVIERYFEKRQQIIARVMQTLYENETSIRTTIERQLEMSTKLSDISANQLERLDDHIAITSEARDLSASHLERLNTMQENFKSYVDLAEEFAGNVNRFGANVDVYHKNLIDTMQRTADRFMEGQSYMDENIRKGVEEFIANVILMTERISSGQEESSETLDKIRGDVVHSIEKMQKLFVRKEDDYSKFAQEQFNRMLKDSLTGIHETYGRAAKKLDETVNKLSSKLDGVDSQVEILQKEFKDEQEVFMKRHTETFLEIRTTMGRIGQMEDEHRTRVLACYENMEKIWSSMDKASIANTKDFKAFVAGVSGELTRLCSAVASGNEAYQKALTEFNRRFVEETDAHIKRLDDIHRELKAIFDENKRANQRLKDMPTSLMNLKVERK